MPASKPKNIDQLRFVYFIGIKGAAMTALAEILARKGVKIAGSDTSEVFFTDKLLKKINARVWEKFSKRNIQRIAKVADLIIHSTAYNEKSIKRTTPPISPSSSHIIA